MCTRRCCLQNYYPFNFVLPTGDLFNFCGRIGRIMVAETGACVWDMACADVLLV